MAIVGIDLGTTNSLCSVFRDGKSVLIPNNLGSYLTPSVVAITEDNTLLVGARAKKYQREHPERAASLFKRRMGQENSHIRVADKFFTPEELSSFVIRSLISDAEHFLGEKVDEAVISVPAYFYDAQRHATKNAGTLSGVTVERIVNEPSAAALALYYSTREESLSLIFDFGGGTLDVSVVDALGNVVGISSIAGDNNLGGSDFDALIAASFFREHGLRKLSPVEYGELIAQSERCKMRLSDCEEADLVFTLDGRQYVSRYSRKRLANESKGLLTRIRSVVFRAIKDAGLTTDDFEAIVMVGGSSKMPLIQSYIQFLFQRSPLVADNCDEQIALGLGVFCGVKSQAPDIKHYSLADICPFSLGTDIYNEGDPSKSLFSVIIPRNSLLPISRIETYAPHFPWQKELEVNLFQGENIYAAENKKLDTITVKIPTSKEERRISVRLTYDINGLLIVDITTLSTGERITKYLSSTLSPQELEHYKRELERYKVDPMDLPENRDIIGKLSQLFEHGNDEQRAYASRLLEAFSDAIAKGNISKIKKTRQLVDNALDGTDIAFNSEEFDSIIVDSFINDYENDLTDEPSIDPEEWEEFRRWTD